jgi:hypothetical protein
MGGEVAAPIDARLRAICDLSVPFARATAGRHEYDGQVQDLSADGVRRGLAALGGPPGTAPYADRHDQAHATAAEHALWVRLGDLALHRSNPLWHLENLDLAWRCSARCRPARPGRWRGETPRRAPSTGAWPARSSAVSHLATTDHRPLTSSFVTRREVCSSGT